MKTFCEKTVREEVKKLVCTKTNEEIQKSIDYKIDIILTANTNIEIIERLKVEASELANILLRRQK